MKQERQVVVVTGSSGRIGTRVIERLAKKYQPIGLDFIGITSKVSEMEFVYVDLSSDESVRCAFDRINYAYGNKIASIIHLAAFYSFEGKNLELYDAITVKGTERLLREAKRFSIEQFIFTSTLLVHNPTKRGIVQNEDSPIEGKWHYPQSKVRTEELIHQQHGEIPYVIIRIAGCYDEECNCVPISQHISRIYEKQLASFVFPGNADNGVPYIHFDDLVDLVMIVLERRNEIPKDLTLVACEEDSISYRDLQTRLGYLLHGTKKWPMIWIPKFVAKVGAWAQGLMPGPKPFILPWMVDLADDNYEFTMDKSRRVLGWEPKRSLRKTLPKMIENLKADPIAWYKRHKIPITSAVRKQARR